MYYVYMIKNQWNDLYVGVTDNPERRLSEHNQKRGAGYTKRQCMFEIVFLEEYETLAECRKREIQIKKWRRDKKDVLVARCQSGLQTKQKTE